MARPPPTPGRRQRDRPPLHLMKLTQPSGIVLLHHPLINGSATLLLPIRDRRLCLTLCRGTIICTFTPDSSVLCGHRREGAVRGGAGVFRGDQWVQNIARSEVNNDSAVKLLAPCQVKKPAS
ncbi:hypothetical protein E2C01_056433 [Portunus trituberculatus]|uniref:Uncharacterized protein n=1 Tax=Portunus trituberculatus TaxID=210409 RepID=A0A5B7GXN8_PORTR|nr:hypothetical protein [Portunus trituberculatus]